MKMSIGLLGQSFFFDFTEEKKKIDDLDGGFEDLYCTFVGLFFCTYKKEMNFIPLQISFVRSLYF
jgi:hypothetical protein